MKNYEVVYYGTCRDGDVLEINSFTISEQDYANLTEEKFNDLQKDALTHALNYFDIDAWADIKEIDTDNN